MMYKQLVLCKINRSAVGRVGWSGTGHGTRLARVWHAPKPLNPIKKSIEPRLVVLVGLVQDMARSAELKLTHVDEFMLTHVDEFKLTHVDELKLTHVAASITSSKVL
jgi:hypothetical protein